MATGSIYLSNQWRIQLAVHGLHLDSVSWSKAQGGDIQPEKATATPGGMAPSSAVGGGRRLRNDIVLQREWSDAMIGAYVGLDNASGNTPATVTLTPLRSAKSTSGKPIVYTGVVGPVKRPDADSYSSNIEFLEVTVWLNESVSGGGG